MAGKNAHLEVSGLTKRFGGLVAVKDMAFSVDAGKILGLIGPNGSGKSTVMKLIMGIERPDAGSVRINGTEVAGWPSHRIARLGAGIVFQHSRPLHRQTVLENIKLALLPDKLTRLLADPETDTKARAIAARVGLERRARPPAGDVAVRRSAQDRNRQSDRAGSAGAADRRAVRRADLEGNRGVLRSDLRIARRRPRRAAGRSQRQKRGAPCRPRARHVCRRAHRRRHCRRGDAQRHRAARLSRRQHRDRGAPGILVPRRDDAVPRGQERQRALRQGAGARRRLDPRPCRRIRLGGRPERRRQDHAVQYHLRLFALCGRHPPRGRVIARVHRGDHRAQGHRAMSRRPRAVRRHDGARKSRPRRPAFAAGGRRASRSPGCSTCSRSCATARSRRPAPCPAASSRC